MSKFCLNCGTELDDTAAVCTNCGAAQDAAPAAAEAPAEKKGNAVVNEMLDTAKSAGTSVLNAIVAKKKLFIIIGAAVLAVVVLILVLSLILGGGGTKGAVESYLRASMMYDAGQIERAIPASAWEYIDENYEVDAKDFQSFMKDYREDLIEIAYSKTLGENVKLSFKIEDENKLSDKKLDALKDNLKEAYDIPQKSISEAVEVEVTVTMSGSDDDDETDLDLVLVKIGGKYYCVEAISTATGTASQVKSEIEDPDSFSSMMEAAIEALNAE